MDYSKLMKNNMTNNIEINLLQSTTHPTSVQEIRSIPWFTAQGDDILRVNYDLNEDSVVFDVGGYEGEWSGKIFFKYQCNIHIFEPVKEFADIIENRLGHNDKVVLHRFGLSSNTKTATISLAANGSSLYRQNDHTEDINLVKAIDFLTVSNIANIDLMKINIEGAEYDLLEHLIDCSYVKHINNIQIQFHDFVPDSDNRMGKIQETLRATHYLTYQYEYVWENWTKREIPENSAEFHLLVIKLLKQIDSTSDELRNSRREYVSSQVELRGIRKELNSTKNDLQNTKTELQNTKTELDRIKNTIFYKSAKYLLNIKRSLKSMILKEII